MSIINLFKPFNKKSKNSKEEEKRNEITNKIVLEALKSEISEQISIEISNYRFKYGTLNNVSVVDLSMTPAETKQYSGSYIEYVAQILEDQSYYLTGDSHNHYLNGNVILDFSLNVDTFFDKKTLEGVSYNLIEIGEEPYENSIIHSINLSLIIEKNYGITTLTLDKNSIEVKRGVNPDIANIYTDYKSGYTNGYSNHGLESTTAYGALYPCLGNQVIIDTPVTAFDYRKNITDYREIDNSLYDILNHLKSEITKQLEKEVDNLKYLQKRRRRISKFKSDITIDVITEHFISTFDYVKDYSLSEHGEGENISILLNIIPYLDNKINFIGRLDDEMAYYRNLSMYGTPGGIHTFNLTINENNSNFLFELY